MFSIKSNIDRMGFKVKNFKNVTPKAMRKAFFDVGKDLVKDAKTFMDEPKSGKTYLTRLGKSKFTKAKVTPNVLKNAKGHVSSAAGEAPSSWTGKLKKSIDFRVIGTYELEFGVDSGRFGCDYAKYLEYKNLVLMSGKGSKKIAPRPFISRAYAENRQKLVNRLRQEIQQALSNK